MVSETNRPDLVLALGEIFREHGFAGTSLSEITQQTGLGKSSLYHYFPNGKTEMAEAVLENIDHWFKDNVFTPLRETDDNISSINAMFKSVDEYFNSGHRICLVGAFALDNTRDLFTEKLRDYFKEWIDALSLALKRLGHRHARATAEEIVIEIQGALVLARSQNDSKAFTRTLTRLRKRVTTHADK